MAELCQWLKVMTESGQCDRRKGLSGVFKRFLRMIVSNWSVEVLMNDNEGDVHRREKL